MSEEGRLNVTALQGSPGVIEQVDNQRLLESQKKDRDTVCPSTGHVKQKNLSDTINKNH